MWWTDNYIFGIDFLWMGIGASSHTVNHVFDRVIYFYRLTFTCSPNHQCHDQTHTHPCIMYKWLLRPKFSIFFFVIFVVGDEARVYEPRQPDLIALIHLYRSPLYRVCVTTFPMYDTVCNFEGWNPFSNGSHCLQLSPNRITDKIERTCYEISLNTLKFVRFVWNSSFGTTRTSTDLSDCWHTESKFDVSCPL